MSAVTPVKTPPCAKCGNTVRRGETDDAGITLICTICGACVYLNKAGNPMVTEEFDQLRDARTAQTKSPAPQPADSRTFREDENHLPSDRTKLFRPLETTTQPNGPILRLPIGPQTPHEPQSAPPDTQEAHQHTPDFRHHQPTPQETTEMAETQCPHCKSPQPQADPRHLLTTCTECRQWFMTVPQEEYDRSDLTAIVLHLFYQGMKTRDTCVAASRITGQPPVKTPTVLRWTRDHTQAAIKESQKYRPRCGPAWMILQSRFDNANTPYYAWTITDVASQYILATQISETPVLDSKLARAAIQIASTPPRSVIINTQTNQFLTEISKEFRAPVTIEEDLTSTPTGEKMTQIHLAIKLKHKQFTRNRRNMEAINTTMAGIALVHNLFERSQALGSTPAEAAGITPRFTSWADVVKRNIYVSQAPSSEQPEQTPPDAPAPNKPPIQNGPPTEEPGQQLQAPPKDLPTSTTDPQAKPETDSHKNPDNDPADRIDDHHLEEKTMEKQTPVQTPRSQPEPRPPHHIRVSQKAPDQDPQTPITPQGNPNQQLQDLFDKLLDQENTTHQAYLSAQKDRMAVARVIELMDQA